MHRLKHLQRLRLQEPRRASGGVVQHLIHQHLVVRPRDLGDEKTPTPTSLAPSVPTLAPANSRNQTATRVGRQIDRQDAQQPVRTTCCAWRGRTAARHNAVRSAQADEKDGGASHRVSRPPRCTPRAPSRHRNKSPADASVTRQGALPWPTRPVGSGQQQTPSASRPLQQYVRT